MKTPLIIDASTLEPIEEDDAAIDRWHDGYFQYRAGKPCPIDADEADGWRTARDMARVMVDEIERPEGYYHMPLGSFD